MSRLPPAQSDGLTRIKNVVSDLRGPGGCPWDMEQTHASLLPNLVEEAYEVVEAIQSGDMVHLCEELGDLLLQVVLHAEIASETGAFDLDKTAHGIAAKLIRRHPHVYADSEVKDTAGVLRQWDEIKKTEKPGVSRSVMDGVSGALPGLSKAWKLQKKAAKVGFDWPDAAGVMDKVREETEEIAVAIAAGNEAAIAEEVGDLLFSVANLARKLGHDPEVLMIAANRKFAERFVAMETSLAAVGNPVGEASVEAMEAAWQSAKHPSATS